MVANTIFLFLTLRATAKFIATLLTVLALRRHGVSDWEPQRLRDRNRIVILVKVYQEANRAVELVDRLMEILEIDRGLSAIIVGTERERVAGQNATLTAIRDLLPLGHTISVIEASGKNAASRPDQINFALGAISWAADTTWVLHLDVDTEISLEGIHNVIEKVNSGVGVILQSSLFTKNFLDLGYFQKGHALLQSRWTLSHEMLRIRASKFSPYVLTHIVGHGSCINLRILKEYGGWPTQLETEDIELGFFLCVNGEPVSSLSTLNNSDTPTTVREGLKQELAWSFGALNYFVYPFYFMRKFSEYSRLRLAAVSLQGILLWLNWMLVSWIFMGGVFFFVVSGSLTALMFLLITLLDYIFFSYYSYVISVPEKPSKFVFYIPALFVAILRRSLSANFGLLRFLFKGRLSGHKTN